MHRIVSLLSLTLAVMLLAAQGFAKTPPPAPTELNPAWGVLFPEEKALQLTHQCSRATPGPVFGAWTPTAIQIQYLELALYPVLAAELKKQHKDWLPSDYYRQYGGLALDGRRVIYINGFHRKLVEQPNDGDKWKTTTVAVCHAAELAFGVEYDPQARTFDKFLFSAGGVP